MNQRILSAALRCVSLLWLLSATAVIAGNTSAQEYGDPVYREADLWIFSSLDHVALFAGIDPSGEERIVHVQNWDHVVVNDYLTNITDYPNKTYWGAYTLDYTGLDFAARKGVMGTAADLVGRDIDYTWAEAMTWTSGASGSIGPDEIAAFRCDGLIEYCYEWNGLDVWGRNGAHYNISASLGYCDEHNDLYDNIWPNDPDTQLAPVVQRGAKGGTSTRMTAGAAGDLPACEVSAVQIGAEVYVTIEATDRSGIHYIGYNVGASTWQYSPTQPQHPTSASYQFTIPLEEITESTWVYYFAVDNGGNAPETAMSVWVEVAGEEWTLNLEPGWNLVSIPVEPYNPACDAVFPPAVCTAVWEYGNPGGYDVPGDIHARKGYWVKAAQAVSLAIAGVRPADRSVALKAGWNLIGVVGESAGDPPRPAPVGGFVSAIWQYDNPGGYSAPTACADGHGFWAKALQDCVIWDEAP